MLKSNRGYQRKYLRAPYRFEAIYSFDGKMHKVSCLNISEGGMLLHLGHSDFFPQQEIHVLLSLPQFPPFKNYNLEKLKDFSLDLFPKKVIPAKIKLVRLDKTSRTAGVQFVQLLAPHQKFIAEYVESLLSNIIHLLTLIDSVNFDQECLHKARNISHLIGYGAEIKIAQLRQIITHEYRSLQWL
jgi:hypothetical protein